MELLISVLQVSGAFFDIWVSGMSYHLYNESKRVLKNLENAVVLDVDSTLETLLKTCPDQRIEYVGLRGEISSLQHEAGTIIPKRNFELIWNNILKIAKTIATVVTPINNKTKCLTHSLTLCSPGNNAPLPFHLHIDHVPWRDLCGIRSNAYLSFSTKYKLANFQNFKEGFPKGIIITIYGKLQRISSGEIRIQYSGNDETPYIFTKWSPQELICAQKRELSKFRLFVIVYAVLGIISFGIFAYDEWKKYCKYQQQNKLMKEVLPVLESLRGNEIHLSCENTHTICIICKTRKRDTLFVNCQHISMCNECAEQVHGKCPVCSKISKKLKYPVYVP